MTLPDPIAAGRGIRAARRLLAIGLAFCLMGRPLHAQEALGRAAQPPGSAGGTAIGVAGRPSETAADSAGFPATPVVPDGHWSRAAARQLALLGLAPGWFDRGQGLVTRGELAVLFDTAVSRAATAEQAALAVAYRARWRDEFGDPLAKGGSRRPNLSGSWVGAGFERRTGRVVTGVGYEPGPTWAGPRAIPDTSGSLVTGSLSVLLPPTLALTVEPELVGGRPRLHSAMLTGVLWKYLGGWVGRRSTDFGPGIEGGIVLSDAAALDGFGAYSAQPFRFPWLFRALGPIQLESFFSKVYGGDTIRDPFFVAFRGSMAPHPRLTVALNRGAMFAGRGNEPITLRNMMFLFTGGTGHRGTANDGRFANDMLSVDFAWRPPVERALPAVLYLEWGMDNDAGMWHRAPGIIAGAEAVPSARAPWLSLGLERTSFAHSDLQGPNPIWYRNGTLRQGWADYGLPVGHPLAGVGQEWTFSLTAAPWSARLRLRGAAYARRRDEQNLLAPERAGRSRGGWLRGELQLSRRVQVTEALELEKGASGWTQASSRALLRLTP